MPTGLPLTPHHDHRPWGVRRIYIQNLTDLLHVCLLRGEVERARRAWGILVSPVAFAAFKDTNQSLISPLPPDPMP